MSTPFSFASILFGVASVLGGTEPDPQLVALGYPQRVQPRWAAAYTLERGRMILTSEWISLGAGGSRSVWRSAWDSYDTGPIDDPTIATPTDAAPGCTEILASDQGARWFRGVEHTNAFSSCDISGATPGAMCEGLMLAWRWSTDGADRNGDGVPDLPCFLAVQTLENMDTQQCTDDGSDFLDGVIYDFGVLNVIPGYYFAGLDLSGTGLTHTMPADGEGGFQMIMGVEFDTIEGILPPMPTSGVQPMLWGTGDHEPIADGRRGTENAGQFDDDNPSDFLHSATDCYTRAGECPSVLSAMVKFLWRSAGDPCPCLGDVSGDNAVDLDDLALLLAGFGSRGPDIPTPCTDVNGDGEVNLADLSIVLARFGAGCG